MTRAPRAREMVSAAVRTAGATWSDFIERGIGVASGHEGSRGGPLTSRPAACCAARRAG
jgi:hypothetical protein